MLKPRIHTFYMENLENNNPLKQLYKNPNKKNIKKFEHWNENQKKYNDNYPTNVRIVFY